MDIFEFMKDVDFVWKVFDLEYTNDDEKRVTAVHWECTGTYIKDENTYVSSRSGVMSNFSPNEEDFIPFENLTEEKCVQWVRNTTANFNQAKVLSSIAHSILEQSKPEVINGVPWEK
jgi:hypothetical protein